MDMGKDGFVADDNDNELHYRKLIASLAERVFTYALRSESVQRQLLAEIEL